MEIALKVSNVSKSFGRKKVIDDVSFELRPGEVFGFLGPNGAGKTTMIKMIMGFLYPDNGKVTINGFDQKKNYERAMKCIGGIVENPEMYKDLSGIDNLKMYARLHDNVPKNRIDEVLEIVGMKKRAKEKVKKYSLGMKQRIGVAQAILHKPSVLILDEPTNGLDPAGIRELRDILKNLAHNEGVAVMVSSHLLSEMQMMCDRVGIIDNGKLIDIKTMEELKNISGSVQSQRIMTPNPQAAIDVLPEALKEKVSKVNVDSFEMQIEKTDIPELIRVLSSNNIEVFGVNTLESSLEDAFLQITGGGLNIE